MSFEQNKRFLRYILHLYVDTARHGRADNPCSSDQPWEYIYFHTYCTRTAKCLTRLWGYPGSSEPCLLGGAKRTG